MPEGGEQHWRAAVAKVLKSADIDTLTSRTRDGIAVDPLYAKAEAAAAGPWRDTTRPVRVIQRIEHPDLASANAQAREDVAGGAAGLALVWAGASTADGFGLPIRDGDDLDAVLEGIDITRVALRFDLPAAGSEAAAEVARRWLERHDFAPGIPDLDVGLDPLDDGAERCSHRGVAGVLRAHGLTSPLLRADGRTHHAAGASEAQELAAVLSAGVAALRALEPLGLDAARDAVSVTLVADTDLLLTIAKLRALRRLWASITAACGLQPRPLRLHADCAWRTLARRDVETNLLRHTLAAAGAILGGADSVSVLPFTAALGLPDGFARRLARNTPLILIEEAGLGRIADPAAGSGAIERLTGALCDEAWRLFQTLERDGGLGTALRDGTWLAAVSAVRDTRRAELAAGQAVMVGVTAFSPSDSGTPAVLLPSRGEPVAPFLPAARDAAPFEAAP